MAWPREVLLADVSKWQISMNWQVFLAAGLQGAILRTNYGEYEDSLVSQFWSGAVEAGVPVGAYMFWLADKDPVKQVRQALKYAGEVVGGMWKITAPLGVWVDCEKGTRPVGMNKKTLRRRFSDLISEFLSSCGSAPGIYTRASWWDVEMLPVNEVLWYNIPIWVAHYNVGKPTMPREWREREDLWFFHQFTSKGDGKKYGAGSTNIDLNAFYGSLEDFHTRFGIIPVPGPEPIQLNAYRVNRSYVNFRSEPVVSEKTHLGRFLKGKLIYPDGVGTDSSGRLWFYIGNAQKIWVASWLLEETNIKPPYIAVGGKLRPVEVVVDKLNVRDAPIITESTVIGQTSRGKVFYPDGAEVDSSGRLWYWIGKSKKIWLAGWLTRPVS